MNRVNLLKRIARQLIPNTGTVVIVIALLWAQQAGALGLLAPDATSTSTISYQGRLADSAGNPVNTEIGMTFRIYNSATGSSALWTETYSAVSVSDGLFHVLLGSTTPLPNNLFSNNSTLYLGVTVGADSEMIPREQLASAPYAMQANLADLALTVPDGAITSNQLNLNSGIKCLTSETAFNTTARQSVNIPALNLSFVLDKSSKVLIWMDGMARSEQAAPIYEDIQYYLMLDGVAVGGSIDVDTNYWNELKTMQLVSLSSGTHTIGVNVYSFKNASIWMSYQKPYQTCVNYIVIGQ